MMESELTALERADQLDARDMNPVAVSSAYEEALQEDGADLDTYLNLAVLYWASLDHGQVSRFRLDREFIDHAWKRANELLDEAERRFGNQDELEFWRYYFAFVTLGEPEDLELCRRILAGGRTKIPLLHLSGYMDRWEYEPEIAELTAWAADGATRRKRYIRAVLESWASKAERYPDQLLEG